MWTAKTNGKGERARNKASPRASKSSHTATTGDQHIHRRTLSSTRNPASSVMRATIADTVSSDRTESTDRRATDDDSGRWLPSPPAPPPSTPAAAPGSVPAMIGDGDEASELVPPRPPRDGGADPPASAVACGPLSPPAGVAGVALSESPRVWLRANPSGRRKSNRSSGGGSHTIPICCSVTTCRPVGRGVCAARHPFSFKKTTTTTTRVQGSGL